MSTEENKDLVRRLFDAINNQSLDEPDTLLDPDFRLNGEHVSLADFQEWFFNILVIASLIEEEYGIPEEMNKIARVIHNRLEIGDTVTEAARLGVVFFC